MSPHPIARLALAAALAGLVCNCAREKQATPAEMQARFHALLDTLNADTPGASAEQLAAFLQEAGR